MSATAEPEPLLAAAAINKRFGGVAAVTDVDLVIHPAEVLGVVGPNGSGKTTLFNCLTGFLRLSAGRVRFLGRDTTNWAPERICAAGMVRTFQQPMIFAELATQRNVEVVAAHHRRRQPAAVDEVTVEALELVGLAGHGLRLAGSLSYGQQRELGVAMALATAPRLLLMDEPASGLNDEETARLATMIQRIRARGVAVCVIDHDMELIQTVCDRLVVLDAGRKIAEGEPGSVSRDPEVVRVYLGEGFATDTTA